MKNLNELIMDGLKAKTRVTEADIRKALTLYTNNETGQLSQVLINMGVITEKELRLFLNVELKVAAVSLRDKKIDSKVGKMIPERQARRYQLIPISNVGNTLTLAMLDPLNIFALDDIAVLKKNKVECVLSSKKEISDALDKLYGRVISDDGQSIIKKVSKKTDGAEAADDLVKIIDEADTGTSLGENMQAPAVRIVDLLLQEAIKRRASDIHIEPYEDVIRVRYRIDGTLGQSITEIPKKNQNAILIRLKILSRIDITENRVPQDGRFKIKLGQKEIDFRVSILPVHFGSKVVMRILDKSALSVGLDHLGFLPETLKAFKEATAKPFGMILITGPTGSGKSTTLYSILNEMNRPDKNVVTIEDPIEYQMAGITQIQAKPEIGLDFANGLRAVLRQSPDIVMVGEIRDGETADIAIKASLTGQSVLSTLHTNDAASAVTRLVDMKIEPFLIASSVILIAAQRLCRKVCNECKEKVDIPSDVFTRLGVPLEQIAPKPSDRNFVKGKGCDHCNQTGYFGRMGILETLPIDDTIRDMIVRRASSTEIKDYAVKNGMITLREDALKKCCLGLTTLDEVVRITSEDE